MAKDLNIENNFKMWDNTSTWIDGGEEWSKHFNGTDTLWDEILYPRIKEYVTGNVLEIAPGHGRITRKLLEQNISLSVIDLSVTCINTCRNRFGKRIKNYHVGNGEDLTPIESSTQDFIFSFDSFVHMDKEVISSYIKEMARVLKPKGYAWIHHSNLCDGNVDNFQNIAGRSNMDLPTFKSLANQVGKDEPKGSFLDVVSQETIAWNAEGNPTWLNDGLTLMQKR